MKSNRLSDVFACVMAVVSESVPIALLNPGVEVPGSSCRHGSSHFLAFLKLSDLANRLRETSFQDHENDESSLYTPLVVPFTPAKVSHTYPVGQARFA